MKELRTVLSPIELILKQMQASRELLEDLTEIEAAQTVQIVSKRGLSQ